MITENHKMIKWKQLTPQYGIMSSPGLASYTLDLTVPCESTLTSINCIVITNLKGQSLL